VCSTENCTRGKQGSKHGNTEGLSFQFFHVSRREAKETLRKEIGAEKKGDAVTKLETSSSCWCLSGLSNA